MSLARIVITRIVVGIVIAIAPSAFAMAEEATSSTTTSVRLHPDDPRADHTGTPPLPPPEAMAEATSEKTPGADQGHERQREDYDRRPDEPVSAGDILIWVPRIVFLPLHLTLEYVVRRPMIALITFSERHKVFARLGDIFTFRDGKSGIFPTALLDFGLSPSVGIYTFHDDIGFEGHRLTLQAGFWIDNWKRVAAADTWRIFDGDGALTFRGEFVTRPDELFYGIGYASDIDDRTYLRFRRFDGEIALSSFVDGLSQIGISARLRDGKLTDGKEPSFSTKNPTPLLFTGFGEDGYQLVTIALSAALDTRAVDREFTSGSGVRLDLRTAANFSTKTEATDLSFLRFGGEAAAFWDMSGRNHVLGLSLASELIEKIGTTPVPLTELILLGGPETLRGFLFGRFRGESAFVATVDYRWPVWILLDANLFLGVGNAFGANLRDFGWRRLALSGGFALRFGLSRDTSLDALIALGTSRFDEEVFEVDNVRITIGANHAF